jgi:hypothetical protein
MYVLKSVFGGICVLGGLVIIIGIILASSPVGILDTFSGLSYSIVPFAVIGLFGLLMIIIGIALVRSP